MKHQRRSLGDSEAVAEKLREEGSIEELSFAQRATNQGSTQPQTKARPTALLGNIAKGSTGTPTAVNQRQQLLNIGASDRKNEAEVPHREHLATDDAPLHFAKLSFDRSSAQHYEVRKLLSNTDGSDTKQEAEDGTAVWQWRARGGQESPALIVLSLRSVDASQDGERSCASQAASWDWRVVNADGTTEPCMLTPQIDGESVKPAYTDGERSCTSQAASWDWQVVADTPLLPAQQQRMSATTPSQHLRHALSTEVSPQTWISVDSARSQHTGLATPQDAPMAPLVHYTVTTRRSPSASSSASPRTRSSPRPPLIPGKSGTAPVQIVQQVQDSSSTQPLLPWSWSSQQTVRPVPQPSAGSSGSTSSAKTGPGSMVLSSSAGACGSRLSRLPWRSARAKEDPIESASGSEVQPEVVSRWRYRRSRSRSGDYKSAKQESATRYGCHGKLAHEGETCEGMEVFDPMVYACTADANAGNGQTTPAKLWDSLDWQRPWGAKATEPVQPPLQNVSWMGWPASGFDATALPEKAEPRAPPPPPATGAVRAEPPSPGERRPEAMLGGAAGLRLPELRAMTATAATAPPTGCDHVAASGSAEPFHAMPGQHSAGQAGGDLAHSVEGAPRPTRALLPQEPLPKGTRPGCSSEVLAQSESRRSEEVSKRCTARSPQKAGRLKQQAERRPSAEKHMGSSFQPSMLPSGLSTAAALLSAAWEEVSHELDLHDPKSKSGHFAVDDDIMLRAAALRKLCRERTNMQSKSDGTQHDRSRGIRGHYPQNTEAHDEGGMEVLLDMQEPCQPEKSSPTRSHRTSPSRARSARVLERQSGHAVSVPAKNAAASVPRGAVDPEVKATRQTKAAEARGLSAQQRLATHGRSVRAFLQDLLAQQAWMVSARQLVYHYSLGRVMQPPGTSWSSANRSTLPDRMPGRPWVFFLSGDQEEKKLVRLLSSPRGFAEACEGKVLLFALDLRYAECLGAKTGWQPCECGQLPSKMHGLLLIAEIVLGRCVTATRDLSSSLVGGLHGRPGQFSGAVAMDGDFAEAQRAGADSMYFPSLGVIALLDPARALPMYMCEYARYRTLVKGRADARSM